jgi:hypothetical protein
METTLTTKEAGIFQIRTTHGRKLEEFQSHEEAVKFLTGRDNEHLEVWHLERSPGELLGIYRASEFVS